MERKIRARLSTMPSATAKVAHFLLENPQAPLTLSIGELAEQAGTSAATVTRFCRAIGYHGYVELRVTVATDVGRTAGIDSVAQEVGLRSSDAMNSWVYEIGESFGPDDSPGDLLSGLMGAHARSLREAASSIDLAAVTEVAALIAECEQVDLYGVAGSAASAGEMQNRLYRIGIRTYCWSEVHAGLASAAIQDSTTVAIGMSLSGRTEETIQMLSEAKKAGARTVAVVADRHSPLAGLAEYTIVTSMTDHRKSDDLSAKHGQLLVVDLLYLLVAQADFDRSSDKLAASASAVASHRRSSVNPAKTTEGPHLD